MLILVAVTINLAADGGLFEKARTASKDTEQKKILEELISMAEFNNDGKIDVNNLKDKVTEKYKGSSYDGATSKLTVKGNKGEFNYKVTDTEIKLWEENDNSDTKTLSELYCSVEGCTDTTHLHKGDYVEYIPKTAQTTYAPDKGEGIGKYTGYTEGESEQSIPQESLNWRVLGKDTNGNILLISGAPTGATLAFYGYVGYNNYEDVLNDTCNALYSNTGLGATARSITMDDIDTYLGGSNYDKKDCSHYATYGNQNESEITSKFKYNKATNTLTKENYTIPAKELTSSGLEFTVSAEKSGAKNIEILLAGGEMSSFYISTRGVSFYENKAVWLGYIGESVIWDCSFCHSTGDEFAQDDGITLRPVVSLPSSVTTKQVSKTTV